MGSKRSPIRPVGKRRDFDFNPLGEVQAKEADDRVDWNEDDAPDVPSASVRNRVPSRFEEWKSKECYIPSAPNRGQQLETQAWVDAGADFIGIEEKEVKFPCLEQSELKGTRSGEPGATTDVTETIAKPNSSVLAGLQRKIVTPSKRRSRLTEAKGVRAYHRSTHKVVDTLPSNDLDRMHKILNAPGVPRPRRSSAKARR